MHELVGFEIFSVYYYGVLVFLGVGTVDREHAYVYELELKKVKHGKEEMVSLVYDKRGGCFKGKKPADCLIVPQDVKHNSFCSKTMEIKPITLMADESTFLIEVDEKSRLYKKAMELGIYEPWQIFTGTITANQISDGSRESYDKLRRTLIRLEEKKLPDFNCDA